MKIECPGCGAGYELPESAVPDPGRDVQCSACGTAWFLLCAPQSRTLPDTAADSASGDTDARVSQTEDKTGDESTAAAMEPPVPPRRRIDPSVLAILREEADVEVRARHSAPGAGAAPPPQGARDRLARLAAAERAQSPGAATATDTDDSGLVEDPRAAQRDPRPPLLNTIPMRPAPPPGRDLPVRTDLAALALRHEARRRAGFRLGFGATAGLCCAALALYLLAASSGGFGDLPLATHIHAQGDRVQTALAEFVRRVLPTGGA